MFTTPPLAPKVISTLADCGIHSIADLQAVNPCYAFLLLKDSGLTITQSVFWQLVSLCTMKMPHQLTETERNLWQQQLKEYPPVRRFPDEDEMQRYMQAALNQAMQAAMIGEIPVGAVIVYQNQIIASSYNRCISDHNISHHAEIQALAKAGQYLDNYRLENCDLYVTLEPCSMCAGAIIQARIKRLIYAAAEPKTGAAGSIINLFNNKMLNNHTAVHGGILSKQSVKLLQDFFQKKRTTST